ncbi:MAG: nicotinamide riboside transporter PnuC [Paludibacteraceae bacterium]
MQYFIENWVEITGAAISVIYLILSIREKAGLWIFGFLSSLLYIRVFYHSKLYAEISLQLYYLFVSIYGWITWKFKPEDANKKKLEISRIEDKQILGYLLGTIGMFLVYFVILKFLTDSPIPFADSVVGALSIIGTWMLAKKKIENWLVWIVADAFAAGLYFYKGLYPTAILFVVYTTMAIVGYFQWKKKNK